MEVTGIAHADDRKIGSREYNLKQVRLKAGLIEWSVRKGRNGVRQRWSGSRVG